MKFTSFITSPYGFLLIIFSIAIIFVACYIIYKEKRKQEYIKTQLELSLKNGIKFNIPFYGKEKECQNPFETYAIFYGAKINGISLKPPKEHCKKFQRIIVKSNTENIKPIVDYIVNEVLQIEDKIGRKITFFDIEKKIQKKNLVLTQLLDVIVEDNFYECTFYGNELNLIKKDTYNCYKAGKRKLQFVLNGSCGNQRLNKAKKLNSLVKVQWAKDSDPLFVKDYVVTIIDE